MKKYRRPKYPVLIVEDEILIRNAIKDFCEMELNMPCATAANGEEAVAMLSKSQNYSLFIVDLMMPIMGGKELIKHLKRVLIDPLIIVQTGENTPETIIEVMKMRVFDYIIKPIDFDILSHTIEKGLEMVYLQEVEREILKNAGKKLRGQLEWLTYKDTRRELSKDSQKKDIIYNLNATIAQGSGFGTMVSLVDLMKSISKKENNSYKVDASIMEQLFTNNEVNRIMLEGMSMIVDLLSSDLKMNKVKIQDFNNSLPDMMEEIIPFFENKKMGLTWPKITTDATININDEKVKLAVEELAINAYKYGQEKSELQIYGHIAEGYYCLTFKNVIAENPGIGIPSEYEKLVSEPFFRLQPPTLNLKVEKFTLGLGLTVVSHITRKHDGMFFIHEMIDHSGNVKNKCILAELFFPTNAK